MASPTPPTPVVMSLDQAIANVEISEPAFNSAMAKVQADSAILQTDNATLTTALSAYQQDLVNLVAAAQAAESNA
jgi:hypothetical protein